MKVNNYVADFRYQVDIPKPKIAPQWLAARIFTKRELMISKIAKTPRIAHRAQRLELLSRIEKRHERLTAKHEALKLQASRNFDATRQPQYLQAAKEHHAAMLGHRSIVDHARKEWIWLFLKAR